MKSVTLLFFLLGVVFLSACSGTQRAYLQNIELALADNTGVVLTAEDITNSKVDLIYVNHGERAQATMGLAYIEDGRYKWLSADNVLFVTENGRLVKTHGLDHDLIDVTNLDSDPLKNRSNVNNAQGWKRFVDIGPSNYALSVSSIDLTPYSEILEMFDHSFDVERLEEQVEILEQGKTYLVKNIFWYEKNSGLLVRSLQQYGHISEPVTLTYISRIVRLLPNSGAK